MFSAVGIKVLKIFCIKIQVFVVKAVKNIIFNNIAEHFHIDHISRALHPATPDTFTINS
jgi:hypothetical protein